MSYESPIKLITDMENKIIEDQQRNIYKVVCSYNVDISKDELFKLLYDDRKQYDKGHSDGYAQARKDIGQCKDCKYHKEEIVGMVYCPNIVGGWVDNNFYCGYYSYGEVENEADS